MQFYIASQGGGQLRCGLWTPEGAPRAVVQIIHGIAEHIGRYDDFAKFLAARGFVVAADDHMGHGGSVTDLERKAIEDLLAFWQPDGIIVEDSTPDEFFTNPESDRAKDFLSKIINH